MLAQTGACKLRSLHDVALGAVLISFTPRKEERGLPEKNPWPSLERFNDTRIIMSGDSDNPDQEFVCQSDPRNDCVLSFSRPDGQVFSDVHFYYHGAGVETKYSGSIEIGFFQGSPDANRVQVTTTVKNTESITNQSVTGIVTSTPGTHLLTFALDATVTDTGKSQPIRERVSAVVK